MLKIIGRWGLASRLPRASAAVVLALGVGSVACGGKGDRPDSTATLGVGDGVGQDGVEVTGSDAAAADAAETGCGCSSSPNLQALSCASGDGVTIAGTGGLELAPSGDVALFTLCYSRDGQLPADQCRAFRWTRAGGSEALVDAGYHVGLADDGSALVVATQDEEPRETLLLVGRDGVTSGVPLGSVARLSADGRYVVGFLPQPSFPVAPGEPAPQAPLNRNALARWSRAGGLETLAEIPDDMINGNVFDTTADASVIVGGAYDVSQGTLRQASLLYTAQQGLRRLEDSPSGEDGGLGFVSRDGSAFAGLASPNLRTDLAEAFYWTSSGGFRSITTANPIGGVAFYQRLSDDGLVVAGTGWLPDAARHRVYRWTAAGLSWLGPDDAASRIADMTADGSLVLGTLIDTDQGFIASPGETRRFNELLARASLDSTGWELQAPLRISDDGKVVFGSALCGGVPTVYRWVLPE
jgi:hypothetical protein